jgi:hypothetical protein
MKKGRFGIHPGAVVLGVALLIFGSLPVIRYLTPQHVEAKFTLAESQRRGSKPEPSPTPHVFAESLKTGEAYTAVNRLAELEDLVVGIAVYSNTRGGAPPSLDAVLTGMAASGKLTPGVVVVSAQGKLDSPHSTFYVRYRAVPFAVEVVSLPRTEEKGGAMLLRLPSDPNEPVPVTVAARSELKRLVEGYTPDSTPFYGYYTSPQKTSATLPPAAFMPAEQMERYGWTRDTLPRPAKFTPQQRAEQEAYLKRLEGGR